MISMYFFHPFFQLYYLIQTGRVENALDWNCTVFRRDAEINYWEFWDLVWNLEITVRFFHFKRNFDIHLKFICNFEISHGILEFLWNFETYLGFWDLFGVLGFCDLIWDLGIYLGFWDLIWYFEIHLGSWDLLGSLAFEMKFWDLGGIFEFTCDCWIHLVLTRNFGIQDELLGFWDLYVFLWFHVGFGDLSENLKFWHSANLSEVLGFYIGFKDLFRS